MRKHADHEAVDCLALAYGWLALSTAGYSRLKLVELNATQAPA